MPSKSMLLQKGYVLEQKDGVDKYKKIVKGDYHEEGTVVTHHIKSKKVTVESYYDDHFSSRYSGMSAVPLNEEWLELLKNLLTGE